MRNATKQTPKGKIGHIRFIGYDHDGTPKHYIVVEHGPRGSSSVAREVFRGTEREAQMRAVEMLNDMIDPTETTVFPANATLDEFFYGRFLRVIAAKDHGGTKGNLRWLTRQYEYYIRPTHGDRPVGSISEREVRACIRAAGSPVNCLKCYRNIMNRAFDDGIIKKPMNFRRLDISAKRNDEPDPWTPAEILKAVDALRGFEMSEMVLYLSFTGARKQEIPVIRPMDIHLADLKRPQGEESRFAIVDIVASLSEDGERQPTKTKDHRRSVIPSRFIARFTELIDQTKPMIRQASYGQWTVSVFSGYAKAKGPRFKDIDFGENLEEARRIYSNEKRRASRHRTPKPTFSIQGGRAAISVFDGYDTWIVKKYEDLTCSGTYDDALRFADEQWRTRPLVPASLNYLRNRWKLDMEAAGLRYIPPKLLRHTNETLYLLAEVSETATQKIHGHTDFKLDYRNYIRLGDSAAVEAALKVDRYFDTPAARERLEESSLSLL